METGTPVSKTVRRLRVAPNGDGTPAESAGTLTPDQLDPDDWTAYPLDVMAPHRGEIPTDFVPRWDDRRGWVACGAFDDDEGPYPPFPSVEVRTNAVGHGDRILDGYVTYLVAHLLNNRTEKDDRAAYEAWLRDARLAEERS